MTFFPAQFVLTHYDLMSFVNYALLVVGVLLVVLTFPGMSSRWHPQSSFYGGLFVMTAFAMHGVLDDPKNVTFYSSLLQQFSLILVLWTIVSLWRYSRRNNRTPQRTRV